jgi:hypothetical protein
MYVDYDPFATSLFVTYHADFDLDGDVDGADLAMWKSNFGLSGTALHEQGDADSDRDVDGADLLVWQGQFGSIVTASASRGVHAPGAAIPEPAALALAVLAFAGAHDAVRRRTRPMS